MDHIIGLHTLNKIRCFKTLHIFGPSGSKKILRKFIDSPFTMPLAHLPYPVDIHELPREQKILPFPVDAKPLLHSSLTLGFRIEIDGRVISYCPDTGYCENAVLLSKNADLLIAECAYKSGQKSHKWPHLNPETAAKIAKDAQAKRLALFILTPLFIKNYRTVTWLKEPPKIILAKYFPLSMECSSRYRKNSQSLNGLIFALTSDNIHYKP